MRMMDVKHIHIYAKFLGRTMHTNTRKLMNAMLICGLACCAQSAFSSTTTLNYQGAAYPNYLVGNIAYSGSPRNVNENVYVGGFNMLNPDITQKSLSCTTTCPVFMRVSGMFLSP